MHKFVATFLLAVCGAAPLLAQAAVDRVEPPFWWAGMKERRLQLMVHGDAIGSYNVALKYPGVKLGPVIKVESANYVFVTLDIAPQAKPGTLTLQFTRGADKLSVPYQLLAREPGSSQRGGFNNADAILNLMPDRFANGDPSNDQVAGYADSLNRASNDAGRHGGDIKGMQDHLDYIAGMGYTAIWPTPLTDSNQPQYSYHGYAATDTYKIDPRYGSNEQYKAFVAQARARGMKVIQDIVLNHIGSNHWWMKDLPTRDWLSFRGEFTPTYHARTTHGDPYASRVDKDNFTSGWFEKNMPDMNQKHPLVATYQIQNTIWWIEYAGLAGVREDTYGYSDAAFLAEWSRRVMQEYPNFNIVGEEWSGNPVVVARWLRGTKNRDGYVSSMPSMMDFPLHDTLREALNGEDGMFSGLAKLYSALVNDTLYADPSALVLFEGNHDVARIYSILNEDLALYKMALAYVATMPRIPQFYYGTEVLMTSTKHRDDGAFRQDFPGGWAGDKVNAVTGAGLTDKQRNAQTFLRTLLNWRKGQSVIHSGKLMHYTPDNGTYVYFRYDDKRKVMVVLNKNKSDTPLALSRFHEMLPRPAAGTDVLSGKRFTLDSQLMVPARSVLILEVQ
ncbi:MAG TPA: glycoside hydrolase family 13 protein [Burkholderiaceae bacterium]